MKTDKEILELLLQEAKDAKKNNMPFLMCKRVEILLLVYNFSYPDEKRLRIEETRIMELLAAYTVQETRIDDTIWYPIDDIDSRIENIKRALNN